MINSYDIFDTIIGRLCYKGTEIFEIIEINKKISNFKNNRILSENKSKTFDEIYIKMQNIYKDINMEEIKKYEIFLEKELSFPINKYLNIIEKNDLLVSDMYLPMEIISNLINKHKIINNKIYVSISDKKNETFWIKMKDKNIIAKHTGDNYISDYQNPLKYNISATHINNVDLNNIENEFTKLNKNYAYLIRAVRMSFDDFSNNHMNYMKDLFCEFVLPFLILISFKIKTIFNKLNIDNIIFLSRDGYWFYEMYKILFPNDKIHYIYFSRLLTKNNSTYIKNTINNIGGKKLVFDLQGSGKTFLSLNLTNCYYFMLFSSLNKPSYLHLFNPTSGLEKMRAIIEYIFYAPHGSVINFNSNIIINDPEYTINKLIPYMNGINFFSKYFKILNKYSNCSYNYDKNIDNIMNSIIYNLCNNDYHYIKNIFNHVNNHDNNYIKYPLKFYSQIEQDKYYIENIINYKPNGVFMEIGAYDGITGSNTYFLEKNLNWSGIIIECNTIMVQKCRENRNCIICDKAIYKESNKEIEIIIPEGKEIVGGKEQLAGIKEYIKPESLNAFKDSYKQVKTITVKTININDLLEQNNIYEIDYVSLDIEGYELEVLKTWDFQKFRVKYLTIEHGNVIHYQNLIREFLLSKGFSFSRNNKWDDEYIFSN
jgi:FkbM family methyltransferase